MFPAPCSNLLEQWISTAQTPSFGTGHEPPLEAIGQSVDSDAKLAWIHTMCSSIVTLSAQTNHCRRCSMQYIRRACVGGHTPQNTITLVNLRTLATQEMASEMGVRTGATLSNDVMESGNRLVHEAIGQHHDHHGGARTRHCQTAEHIAGLCT